MENKNISKLKISTKDIVIIAILSAILFIQEQVLFFLPNVQLTMLFVVLYSKKIGCTRSIFTIFVYVLLDNIASVYFNILWVIFMFIGWSIVPIMLNTLFKRVNNVILLSLLSGLFSFVYCWCLVIPGSIIMQKDIITYLKMDIIWELMVATSSIVSVLLLYYPLSKFIDKNRYFRY